MTRYLLRPLMILAMVAGCESALDVSPINEISEDDAITGPLSARAAVAGIYDALQDDSYYGGDFLFLSDLSAEDVEHTGTFTDYRQADLNGLTADNATIEVIWDALYRAIGRANIVIARVPGVVGLDPVERDQLLGEAYFLRALTYHNLVKLWGEQSPAGAGVPLVITPPADVPTANQVTRQTTGEVYAQILSDLQQAEALITDDSDTRRATVGSVRAIRARVFLYQQNWAGAETEAEAVAAMGYGLAPQYGSLFPADVGNTVEDIFLVTFTPTEFNYIGYYYNVPDDGRLEVAPSDSLMRAYSPGYTPGTPSSYTTSDLRGQRNIAFAGPTAYGAKYLTGVGAEDIHAIRFAEVLLIQAEAEARQNKLTEAETTLGPIRTRAGLAVLDLDAGTQQAAIDAILQERRLELPYEGDRWPDLVRTGLAVARLGIPAFQTLYPIPLNELDVAPGLVQNPGY